MFLNAKQILAARDRETVTVACPEWGGEVLIGVMGALTRARLGDWINSQPEQERDPEKNDTAEDDEPETILTCDSPGGDHEVVDGTDMEQSHPSEKSQEPKWSKTQRAQFQLRYLAACILDAGTYMPAFTIDQIEMLGNKNEDVLARLYSEALKLNADTRENFEELEKNSETASITAVEAGD